MNLLKSNPSREGRGKEGRGKGCAVLKIP